MVCDFHHYHYQCCCCHLSCCWCPLHCAIMLNPDSLTAWLCCCQFIFACPIIVHCIHCYHYWCCADISTVANAVSTQPQCWWPCYVHCCAGTTWLSPCHWCLHFPCSITSLLLCCACPCYHFLLLSAVIIDIIFIIMLVFTNAPNSKLHVYIKCICQSSMEVYLPPNKWNHPPTH